MADALLGGIVINEVLADPNGTINFDTDGSGTAGNTDEFVELFNASTDKVDISGLQLWDAGIGNWFTFPDGTVLAPGAHAMVMTGVQRGGSLPTGDPYDLFFDAGRTSAVINNGGDNVIVYDPAHDEYIASTFNGDTLDDPTLGEGGYAGFSKTATQSGSGEDFGSDTDGESLQRASDGTDTFASATPTPGVTNVCYASGTQIATLNGPRLVEALRPGDMVATLDNGPQEILWVRQEPQPLEAVEGDSKPVLISAGALGPGLPAHDLIVSPQHRILVGGCNQLQGRFSGEAFAPAKSLTSLRGVRHMKGKRGICWVHFACEGHEVVFANGCASESLLLGPMAVNGMQAAERRALKNIFGVTATPEASLNGPPARECLTVGAVRRKLNTVRKERQCHLTGETKKWDIDLAMERHEAELMRQARTTDQTREPAPRVA